MNFLCISTAIFKQTITQKKSQRSACIEFTWCGYNDLTSYKLVLEVFYAIGQ